MPMLKVENISYSVEIKEEKKTQFDILKDVSFEVEQGEIIGICGESGGGKSTLAKVIAGLIKPDSGRIILDSEFEKEKRRSSPIQILFQNHGEVFRNTIEAQINLGVSTPDDSVAVTIEGTRVPGLSTRESSSKVEVNDGETVVLAGIKQSRRSKITQKVPILGSIPLLRRASRGEN